TEREWCDPDVLRRIRRATLATLRREGEPAEQTALGRFLPSWTGSGARAHALLPRRLPSHPPAALDALCASGEVIWVGAGLDRVAVYFREDASVLGRPPAEAPPEDAPHAPVRRAPR